MFLSEASLRRPIAMLSLIIALTLLGMNSYRKLGLELMPKMDVPYITIVTVYPGASPQEIETDVAKRIEDAVVSVDGLKHVTSTCMENVCQTLLEFQLHVDVDIAATDVHERLDLIRDDLPEAVEDPKIQKFDINAKPIVTLALTGEAPLDELYDFADNELRDRLSVIPGVAGLQLIGGARREVQIQLDRRKLAARGLTALDVVQAVRNGVRLIPAGHVKENGLEYSVKFDADYRAVPELADLEVANRNGRRVYVRDVGRVVMTTEELRQQATLDGRAAVSIRVVKKADANAVRVAHAVRDALEEINRRLPGGMELVWVSDDGRFIEATNASAWVNVAQGIGLTALILFLFLYNLRSLLIVSITMPLTILIGLFFMERVGFTLNTSTLVAIGMSVGILVTNSIVVLEAIIARLQAGSSPRDAARLGAGEAFTAVLASAATNVVVLFPLAIMPTLAGLFIRPLALTMVIMTAVSLFISFTLTPMLAGWLLRPQDAETRGWLQRMERVWNRGFDAVVRLYRRLLAYAEGHRWAAAGVVVATGLIFVHALWLAQKVGSSMFAEPDKGEIFVKLEFPTGQSLELTRQRVAAIESRLRDVPELKHILTMVGRVDGIIGQVSEGVHLAQILLRFSERDERELTMDELLELTRKRVAGLSGVRTTVSIPALIGGQAQPVQLEIAGPEFATLDRLALTSQRLAQEIPGILEPDTTVRPGKPELRVEPRRAVLSDIGLAPVTLGMNLRANLEGIEAGTFKQAARNYDIVVKLAEEQGKAQVAQFQLPGRPGQPVILPTVARVEEGIAPIQITRKDKRRISILYANLAPTLPLGKAVERLSDALDAKADFPPGYDYGFFGNYEFMVEAQAGLMEAGLISLILVFLTLAAILESFRQPFLIMVTVPLALVGTTWALALTGESFAIFVNMALVMMIGIVVNNAILIVDHFNALMRGGMARHAAMIEAACGRFRPVAMITLAAVLGMIPLAAGQGIGAELRNAVGIASIGGILVSGILTLILLPILYDLCTRNRRKPLGPTAS